MARAGKRSRRKGSARRQLTLRTELYLEAWMALTPAERLGRSWRLRSRLKDSQAIHDAKTLPRL